MGAGLEKKPRERLPDGDINRAAAAISLIRAYVSPSLQVEAAKHIARTREWLLRVQPKSTDDKAMLLAGLGQADAPEARIQAAGKALLLDQRADGGWGGNPNLESDAYATSEALLALLDSGIVKTTSSVYQNGVRYLLSTRADDGCGTYAAVRLNSSRILKAVFHTDMISGFPSPLQPAQLLCSADRFNCRRGL